MFDRRFIAVGAATLLALAAGLISPATAQTKIKIGTSGGLNTVLVPLRYALDAGIFKKRGLDVEFVDLVDDTTAVQSLISGEFDALYTGAGAGITAIANGADIKLVNSLVPWTDYQFVAQADIGSLKDLEGKTVGVSKIGSVSYLAPIYAFQKEGIDPAKIQFVAVGYDAARGRALISRSIQGAVINGLDTTKTIQSDPTLHVIYDVGSSFEAVSLSNGVFVQNKLIRANPQAIQSLVDSLIETARILQSNKADAISEALSVGLPADVVRPTYDRLYSSAVPYHGVNGGLFTKVVESTIQVLKNSGGINADAKINAGQVLDLQFQEAALKAMGSYKP